MFAWRFKRLISSLQFRVEQEGRKDPAWVVGFVEGLGKRKLTGYEACWAAAPRTAGDG